MKNMYRFDCDEKCLLYLLACSRKHTEGKSVKQRHL